MNKQETIKKIDELLTGWNDPDATNDAATVFEQMPITLAEMQDGVELCFDDLVRLAAHDIQRMAVEAELRRN